MFLRTTVFKSRLLMLRAELHHAHNHSTKLLHEAPPQDYFPSSAENIAKQVGLC